MFCVRFDNILGKETIHTLEYMSSEVRSVLCHSTMVDRVAAMLNYFLYHLVGPNKKNFKVNTPFTTIYFENSVYFY
jgi:ubiquitin conjugation factor E4 A